MDEFGGALKKQVVATLLLLTTASFGVLLWRVAAGLSVPDLLVNLSTTLLGIVTGSVVTLGASPRVDAAENAAVAATAAATASTPTEPAYVGSALEPVAIDPPVEGE